MTDALLYWGMGLLALSLILLFVEVFVPTAGVLGVVSFVLAIVAVICLFRYDWRFGVGGALAILVLGPAAVVFGLQILPSTPLGRKIINADSSLNNGTAEQAAPPTDELAALIDREAEVLTDLRPAGFVRVVGDPSARRIAAASEVGFIAAGTRVRVTGSDGMQVRVRALG